MKTRILIIAAVILHSAAFAQTPSSEVYKNLSLRNVGPATMSGRIVDLDVVESDPFTFYIATATGGVWKTKNNGVTFKPVFENEGTHSIGDIFVHQNYPNHLWVGTGERANRQSNSWGDGVYHSSDAGKTWTNIGLKDSHHIGRVVAHPNDTNTVFVAAMGHLWGTNKERGLYKTIDGGNSWKNVLFIDENTGVVDVAIDPSDPEIMYAATYQRMRRPYGFHGGGPGSGLYKSIDGGDTWKKITEGLPKGDIGRIGISIYRKNPNIVYISVEQGFQYNASTAYTRRKAGVYRSEDKGATWKLMSDWNPRPMYASQILVDPSDDQRIYMMNQYSYSDDGGKTFKPARQSLHGDDRIFWVNPENSKHVMKGDDGGLGISYDRGITWLYLKSLPVSQLYRVSVDMRKPYRIYGGLQDNGSWMGPSETYKSEGIENSDWIKTGGGDGFLSLIHPKDENILFVESQYLGLNRMNLKTLQTKDIRPGDPSGHISARRNWDAWGPGVPEPELQNAMAPANWDGPFHISNHPPHTLYAGTNILWKSTDNGDSWVKLMDLTTKVNRRELKIMGQRADSLTASLDDGIPYYPTISVIEESPLQKGLLYAGTDDGQVQVSTDDGKTWKEVSSAVPGLPKSTWISGIEASAYEKNRVYLVVNNYRNNDFSNYVYVSEDAGASWINIGKGLPENRVARTLREDPKNPNLLFLGTELGLFISIDKGKTWTALKNNMPTLPFNDLVIHPRDNDLVLGSHGRGIWIMDQINALQELTPDKMEEEAILFTVLDAEKIDYRRAGAHQGDMVFRGKNPSRGVIIDYYLKDNSQKDDFSLEIFDSHGNLVKKLKADTVKGINRVVWGFDGQALPLVKRNPEKEVNNRGWGNWRGVKPEVPSGKYKAVLTYMGEKQEKEFAVKDDPRVNISVKDSNERQAFLDKTAALYTKTITELNRVKHLEWALEKIKKEKTKVHQRSFDYLELELKQLNELQSRILRLYRSVESIAEVPTQDQQTQLKYYDEKLAEFTQHINNDWKRPLSRVNRSLKDKISY